MARGSATRSALRRLGWAAALTLAGLGPVRPVAAQELGVPNSVILVIDPGRLFAQSKFGQRVGDTIETRGNALAEENRRIEAELAAEEKKLTEERPGMTPEAFRKKADAFDDKVRKTRSAQEAKANALAQESDAAERRFLGVARPVLEELRVESSASVLLDIRAVLLSTGTIDVTDAAVRRIDEAIGDGSALDPPVPDPAPEPVPEEEPDPQAQD